MIKKLLILVGTLWVAFLFFLIFQGNVDEPSSPVKVPDSLPQKEPKPRPSILTRKITDSLKDTQQDTAAKENAAPLTPMVEAPTPTPAQSPAVGNQVAPSVSVQKVEDESTPVPTVRKIKTQPFGLICTKFERIPSRFRLLKWEGNKRVLLQDLEAPVFSNKKLPEHWFEIRRPYKEFKTPNSGRSVFRPTHMRDPNKRLLIMSIATEQKILAYSSKKKTVAHVVLRDFKLGSTPYELNSESPVALTSGYRINFQQTNGVQEFFHDLTGKPLGHIFGVNGFQYRISKINFPQKILEVVRKDLKTKRVITKEIIAQNLP